MIFRCLRGLFLTYAFIILGVRRLIACPFPPSIHRNLDRARGSPRGGTERVESRGLRGNAVWGMILMTPKGGRKGGRGARRPNQTLLSGDCRRPTPPRAIVQSAVLEDSFFFATNLPVSFRRCDSISTYTAACRGNPRDRTPSPLLTVQVFDNIPPVKFRFHIQSLESSTVYAARGGLMMGLKLSRQVERRSGGGNTNGARG